MLTLEPTPIRQLAEWMADGTWLDMRTPMGRAIRVRVTSLLITPDADELGIEQKWVGEDDRVKDRSFSFDAEEIWDCQPTAVGLLDVVPLKGRAASPDPAPPKATALDSQDVVDAVVAATCVVFDYLKPADLYGPNMEGRFVHHRHQAIIAVYEMTDIPPRQICTRVFTYRSPQPWFTACWKLSGDDGMRQAVKRIGTLADAQLKAQGHTKPCRRQGTLPTNYKPVLVK